MDLLEPTPWPPTPSSSAGWSRTRSVPPMTMRSPGPHGDHRRRRGSTCRPSRAGRIVFSRAAIRLRHGVAQANNRRGLPSVPPICVRPAPTCAAGDDAGRVLLDANTAARRHPSTTNTRCGSPSPDPRARAARGRQPVDGPVSGARVNTRDRHRRRWSGSPSGSRLSRRRAVKPRTRASVRASMRSGRCGAGAWRRELGQVSGLRLVARGSGKTFEDAWARTRPPSGTRCQASPTTRGTPMSQPNEIVSSTTVVKLGQGRQRWPRTPPPARRRTHGLRRRHRDRRQDSGLDGPHRLTGGRAMPLITASAHPLLGGLGATMPSGEGSVGDSRVLMTATTFRRRLMAARRRGPRLGVDRLQRTIPPWCPEASSAPASASASASAAPAAPTCDPRRGRPHRPLPTAEACPRARRWRRSEPVGG